MRRDDADRGIADRGREHLGGPAGRPAPLADGEQRPTSARTMLWQNASATTVTTARPPPSRRQSRHRSARMVVAPSRRRQKAAKSCSPAATVRPRSSRPGPAAGRPQRLAGAAGRRGPHRRRPGRRSGATAPRTARRTRRAPGRRRARGRRREAPRPAGRPGPLDGCPGVRRARRRGRPGRGRAPRRLCARRRSGPAGGQPQHPAERRGHDVLDRTPAGLGGPPGKP